MNGIQHNSQAPAILPASFNQREAAFMYRVYGKAPMFCHYASRLIDCPSVADFKERLLDLLSIHDHLRSYLVAQGDTHVCRLHSREQLVQRLEWRELDVLDLDSQQQNEAIDNYWEAELERGFDIYQDVMLRVGLLRLSDTQYRLCLSVHHLVCDERSLHLLLNRWLDDSPAALNDSSVHRVAINDDKDVANESAISDRQLLAEYWQTELQDCPELYAYPVSNPRLEQREYDLAWCQLELEPELQQRIVEVSQRTELTPEVVLLSCYQLFLHLYCQQQRCAVGVNHYPASSDDQLGNRVNRLPLVSHLTPQSIGDWLKGTAKQLAAAQAHGALPFGEIVDVVHADKAVHTHPLFQGLYSYQELTQDAAATLPSPSHSHFDLRFVVEDRAGQLNLMLGMSTVLFDQKTRTEMVNYFGHLMNNLLQAKLSDGVEQLTLLDKQQLVALQALWPQNIQSADQFPTIPECFERQVEQHPNRVAVYHYDEQLSYAELNERANQCAHYLLQRLNKHQARVAVETDDPLQMLIALLGIFKAGCVYLPIDPELPAKRATYMVNNAQADLFISHDLARYDEAIGAEIMAINDFYAAVVQCERHNPKTELASDELAYFIYTSGSTGQPKGVMAHHAGVVNIAWTMNRLCRVNEDSCFLLLASFGFDASVNDWAGALCNGASLALLKRMNTNIVDEVKQVVKQHPVSVALIPPSFLSFFQPEDFPHLETLIVAAEPVTPQIVEKWTPHFHVLNGYGPTETTVICCTFDCDARYPANTIGQAVDNCALMVLDRHLNPLPPNVIGELYIAGIGLAQGYVAAPETTAESFIQADIQGYGPVRLYKSNDLVMLSDEGNIEFIRRNDRVEKIRGFRVSLTEVDHALEQHPYVAHAASITKEDEDKSILSYVVLDSASMSRFDTVEQWRNIFENSIDYDSRNEEKTFNVSGWSSSYTDSPIPDDEMRVWLEGTTQGILSLQPKHLMEVGCGSGLLLFQLAPHLERYIGTDISKDALLSIKDSMPKGGIEGVSIAVHRLQANEMAGFADDLVDTIICNSVMQYFPSMDYFIEVLDGFFRVLQPGGSLYLGDIRNQTLAHHFHALVESAKSQEIGASDFLFQVDQRVHRDPELLIDPELFRYLKQRYPQISRVRVLLKRGAAANEMNQFRYDVLIETADQLPMEPELTLDWSELSSIEATERLLATQTELLIKNVPNARVSEAVSLLGDKHIESFRLQAAEPEAFFDLAEQKQLTVELSYAHAKDDCYFDVSCSRRGASYLPQRWPQTSDVKEEAYRRGNIPYEANRERQCLAELNEYLKAELPVYMRPRQIFCIDAIPYNFSGKLDRHRLPRTKLNQRLTQNEYRVLATATEKQLGVIWQRILDVERVGLEDNFFDLGGNSFMFLGFISEIETEFGVKLSVMDIMRSSLFDIAQKIDALNARKGMVS